MKLIEVTAAIICKDNKILICQRPENKNCGLLWEFPGGKLEIGETGEQCIIRECQEELGVTLHVESKITDIVYKYPDYAVHLHFYLCNIVAGVLENREHNMITWISPNEVVEFDFCPADKMMLQLKYNLLCTLVNEMCSK